MGFKGLMGTFSKDSIQKRNEANNSNGTTVSNRGNKFSSFLES